MRLPDGQTLLEDRRAAGLLAGHGEIVTVTNREHYFQSKDQFQAARLGQGTFHPRTDRAQHRSGDCRRRPGAASRTWRRGGTGGDAGGSPDPQRGGLPRGGGACRACRRRAPGYLRRGAGRSGNRFRLYRAGRPAGRAGAAKVRRFVEKPDEETARRYVESGGFLWNSGMFCFTASTLVDELAQHAPACWSRPGPPGRQCGGEDGRWHPA